MDLYQSLPKLPGIYFFKNARGVIIYIGKAKNLKNRVSSYFTTPNLLPRTANLVTDIKSVDYIETESEIDAFLLEANMIRKFAPKYNVNWKDGKSYPLIEITTKDKIPQVKIVRQETNPKATYFGPYPTGSDLFNFLRFLRRIFPFVSQNHPGGKPCLRSHLSLCPCPDVFTDQKALKKYRDDLHNLVIFLRGDSDTLKNTLARAMLKLAKEEHFEEAARVKKQLDQIAYITASRTLPWDYEVNPNLTSDRISQSVEDLRVLLGLRTLNKIECYDISNTSGKQATGAQITFVAGLPDKSLYRRYKIKFKTTPDDFAMIKEVLSRRLKSEITLPELMVIDGGSGQVSAAASIIKTPVVIGLAKRLEEIYLTNGTKIRLPSSSPVLHLLQQLRDEAHRFSRKYHFLLRKKKMLG